MAQSICPQAFSKQTKRHPSDKPSAPKMRKAPEAAPLSLHRESRREAPSFLKPFRPLDGLSRFLPRFSFSFSLQSPPTSRNINLYMEDTHLHGSRRRDECKLKGGGTDPLVSAARGRGEAAPQAGALREGGRGHLLFRTLQPRAARGTRPFTAESGHPGTGSWEIRYQVTKTGRSKSPRLSGLHLSREISSTPLYYFGIKGGKGCRGNSANGHGSQG